MIYISFKICRCLELKDNVLGIKFESLQNGEVMVLFCVYLLPEGSKYSTENEMVLNNLTIEIYNHNEADCIVVCGDFNGRMCERNDVTTWDSMLPRNSIDKVANIQGDRLLTFVNNIKGCVLNGRISPEYDDYTSIASHKGSAVVDYFISRQADISSMQQLHVHTMVELIEELGVKDLISNRSSIPDHSLLCLDIETSLTVTEQLHGNTLGSKSVRTKVLRKTGENYMKSDTAV